MFFTYAIKKEASLILKGAPEIVVQKIVAGRHDLFPVSYIETIKNIRGVASVENRLWGYYYDSLVSANYTLLTPPSIGDTADAIKPSSKTATVVENESGGQPVKPLFELGGRCLNLER